MFHGAAENVRQGDPSSVFERLIFVHEAPLQRLRRTYLSRDGG